MESPKCSNTTSIIPETSIFEVEDVLREILVHIPARFLIRYKCVSKHWLSMISDPEFCLIHAFRNPNSPTSAILPSNSSQIAFIPLETSLGCGSPSCNPLNSVPNLCLDKFNILQSCNGLFLCCPRFFFVLNPTTKQFTKLFPPAAAATFMTRSQSFGSALAFDPSISPHYKVIFVWSNDISRGLSVFHHIEIYSSETRSWKLLNSSFKDEPPIYGNGEYWNGAVHWVGKDTDVAYYHIEEERVGFVDAFHYSDGWSRHTSVHRHFKVSSDGHLRFIDISYHLRTKFQVLEMGRDYCGWFVKNDVDLDPLRAAYPLIKEFHILFLGKGENEEESSSLWLHAPGQVFSYNLKSNTFKSIHLTSQAGVDDSLHRVGWVSHQYMETLACA